MEKDWRNGVNYTIQMHLPPPLSTAEGNEMVSTSLRHMCTFGGVIAQQKGGSARLALTCDPKEGHQEKHRS
jgi:hypothetical protein